VVAAKEATNYLLGLGHERIAFIYGEHKTLLTQDRENGYREAMTGAKKTIDSGWVVEGKLTLAGAIAATDKLLAHPKRPTAIFCANDEMAMGCLHAVKAAGLRIPDDISVIGFDDNRYAHIMDPPLTTVRQPAYEIGERVMLRLLHEIENGRSHDAEPEIVPHELVIRDSAAPPRFGR
jgi:LacI family repressor for deo operon, udp, cdd, tsx, nupC, and nupG